MSKADPKHGRWILPLVIAGLIGFTYLFVDALPPAAVDAGDPTDTVVGGDPTDTTTDPTDDTGGTDDTAASSTLAQDVAAFVAAIDDFDTRTAALATEAATINADWDARTIEFAAARDALSNLEVETSTLVSEINDTVAPADASEAWNVVLASAQTLQTAAADMLDGLVNSSTADQRLAALDTYTTTASDLAVGYDLARSAVGA